MSHSLGKAFKKPLLFFVNCDIKYVPVFTRIFEGIEEVPRFFFKSSTQCIVFSVVLRTDRSTLYGTYFNIYILHVLPRIGIELLDQMSIQNDLKQLFIYTNKL